MAETVCLTRSELLCLVGKEKSGPEEAPGAASPTPLVKGEDPICKQKPLLSLLALMHFWRVDDSSVKECGRDIIASSASPKSNGK